MASSLDILPMGFGGKEEMSAAAGGLTAATGALIVAFGISMACTATGFAISCTGAGAAIALGA